MGPLLRDNRHMRFWVAMLIPFLLGAQGKPGYDPNDPEGIVNHANGWARFPWKRQGTWTAKPVHNPYGRYQEVPVASAADVQRMNATLDALTALLRATPEGADPRGYRMNESRTFGYYNPAEMPPGVSAAKQPFIYSSGFFPFYLADIKRNGVWAPDPSGETESVYFYFNRLPGKMSQKVVASEPRPGIQPVEFYTKPEVKTTFAGFPVVDGQDLLIVRGGRDPWAAVPYGRVLKAAMAGYEKDRQTAEERLAGLKKKEAETMAPEYEQQMRAHLEKYSGEFRTSNPAKWKGREEGMLRELAYNREKAKKDANPQRDKDGNWYWQPVDAHAEAAKRLAALTPEEAAKPACWVEAANEQGRYAVRGSVLAMGMHPQCREVVMDNYDYFDAKLPRNAPQLLLVRSLGRCAKVVDGKLVGPPPHKDTVFPPQGCQRHVPIWQAMDWQKVAGLLAP
jgi:hypothetical protein